MLKLQVLLKNFKKNLCPLYGVKKNLVERFIFPIHILFSVM